MDGKGGPFLHQLTVREWKNPEFQFCQPRHIHFAYFSALVDAYRTILRQWISSTTLSTTTIITTTPESILREAAYRAEYERDQQLQQSQKQQEEGEIVAIDWHDFVVVETIDFPADEMVVNVLPPPTASAVELLPSQPTTAAAAGIAATMPRQDDENGMDESSDEEDGETIRVVPSYQPKVVGASDLSSTRAIDPVTGKSISVADVPQHLRIQLLDPKWAEERKKFQEKQKDSNLVGGEAMVANVSRLAREGEENVASATTVPVTMTATNPVRMMAPAASMSLPKRSFEAIGGATNTGAVSSPTVPFMDKRPRIESNLFQSGDAAVEQIATCPFLPGNMLGLTVTMLLSTRRRLPLLPFIMFVLILQDCSSFAFPIFFSILQPTTLG